ncbi:GNAT family N-acetyltransferase [Spirulina sp. 06S082]|uniref:GNAT family N-acetyltransferase n=1 Tax=Spirulina sp. 06S082 TaxID=3110248 RepID=UPI003A4D7DAA
MGYWIGVEFWGRGYASEAARSAIAYGFEVLTPSPHLRSLYGTKSSLWAHSAQTGNASRRIVARSHSKMGCF